MLNSVLMPANGFNRILNWRLVSHLGVLSYSIYIWQQLFCSKPESFGLEKAWWLSFPYWIVPAFFTAIVSYYVLERPILSLRHKFK
jgi:peptidoglycan/LPS O-acetylase OafA/YrhL